MALKMPIYLQQELHDGKLEESGGARYMDGSSAGLGFVFAHQIWWKLAGIGGNRLMSTVGRA